jgi:hypothetical protein
MLKCATPLSRKHHQTSFYERPTVHNIVNLLQTVFRWLFESSWPQILLKLLLLRATAIVANSDCVHLCLQSYEQLFAFDSFLNRV